jgi:5-dehydro-2-deoxygluconokinase
VTAAVPAPAVDVLTMGRVGVDLYPHEPGPLETVRTFGRYLGGSATNVAVAAARLGRTAAVVTKVGADPFGAYVRDALTRFGVSTAYVGTDPDLRTPLVFAALDPADDPPVLFYRQPSAPDLQIDADDVPDDAVRSARLLWVTGTGLSVEPSRRATLGALALRDRAAVTVLDLDYRPVFWASAATAHDQLIRALPLVTVAVGNRVEVEVAVGTRGADEAADRLLAWGIDLAVVKLGRDGVLVATPQQRITLPPVPVEVVCGLGAGDAFGGALCHGLLSGWPIAQAARFANAAGALVAARLACADAMPTVAEVDQLLEAARAG